MKRYRHYNRKRAIVLACFGSVIEQQKYLDLEEKVKEEYPDCEVFTSFSSRMVIKLLKKKKKEIYKNLPQTLADVDMLGFKHVVVVSVNIYPTDEHEFLKKIVDGFKIFSLANIGITNAILTTAKDTTEYLKELNEKVSKEDTANLYIIHGTPKLNTIGIESISYTKELLKTLDARNFSCSLEGAFPYFAINDSIKREIKAKGYKKVQVVPLLLVSGNHYIKDMFEIKEDLEDCFESSIVESITQGENFNLLEFPKTSEIIINNIKESFKMLGISHKTMTY
ncbi:sirohydrochlorin cobaltochelatase [Halarcobacter ebronensis]|uniref:Cobalt chelatase n=1 Tax=Halarcobacter ebronensis TaxID=1462615 RepID=A0A4Q1ARS7_9BACT|nr:sirohydrochlorin cobaltochelatase [Halarcobacter ebronensis]QKF82151.1 sirohydrochlorin cobaltochelatase [Halarcobacter ebronensis]RXK03470.1 cobalt chelatase [Halarcobacter ebronensis]